MKNLNVPVFIGKLLTRNVCFWKCFLFLFFFSSLAFSTEVSFLSNINFRQFGPEDGLPTAQVPRIIQDHLGFMWFATHDGLIRYDSHEFHIYRHDPSGPGGISSNIVWDIAEDREGNIWIGSDGGLDLWRRESEDFVHFSFDNPVSSQSNPIFVHCLFLEDDRSLWIGTSTTGLFRMDLKTGKITNIRDENDDPAALTSNIILSLHMDSKGILWIGTQGNGLKRLDPETEQFQAYRYDPEDPQSIASNQIRALGEDLDGNLWIGTTSGVSQLDPGRRLIKNIPFNPEDPNGLHGNRIEAILRDQEGRMWFGTNGAGISRYEPETGRFVHFTNVKNDSTSLISNTGASMCQDRNGDLWVGHMPMGVSFANRLNASFHYIRSNPYEKDYLPDETVHAILEDSSGGLWIGTNKAGLCHYNNSTKQWECFTHDPADADSLSSDTVMALTLDYQGNILIGAWGGGVDLLTPGTRQFRHFKPEPGNSNSLSSPFIFGITEDAQHRIWIATASGGVNLYDPSGKQFTRYQHDPSNPHSINAGLVYCIHVSSSGDIWAGTHTGLSRWNPESDDWQSYPGPGPLAVFDILEDGEKNLWLATNGGGLNHFNVRTGEFTSFGVKDGLPSAMVRSLLEDQQGRLWMGTAEGLVCFNPENRHFRVYDKRSGSEITYFNRSSRLRRQNGELIFGANEGLVSFDPQMIQQNNVVPPVFITGVEFDNVPDRPVEKGGFLEKSITLTSRLAIPSRVSVVSFQFVALNFRSPERNQYLYKLEGFDHEWRQADSALRATYTNLNPGTYRFRVKASNNEGIWNENGASLELAVIPAWWQMLWFKAGVVGLIALIFASVSYMVSSRRYRRRLLEAQKENEYMQEIQKASTARKESEERLNMALEGADMGIWNWDIESGQYRIDRRWAEIAGYNMEELDLRYPTWKELTHPDDFDALVHNLDAHLSGAVTGFDMEYRFKHKKGHWIWIHNKGRVLQRDPDGNPILMSGTHQDISRRKQAEEQLAQAQKIESIGTLAGGIAHDINNMLTPILGYSELILMSLPADDPRRKDLEQVITAAEHSRDLVHQLLAFARRQTLVLKNLNLNRVIENIKLVLRRTLRENIEIVLELAPEIPEVRGDTVQIEQIIINLAVNAQDSMPDGGRLTIGTLTRLIDADESSRVDTMTPGHYVVLTVSDTGVGMDRETQKHIFEPFFTTKDLGKGTGLGLATVYGIAKQHGAFLNLYSELGAGTVFKIFFPVLSGKQTAAGQQELSDTALSQSGTETILLVEDQIEVREVCLRFLKEAGYQVLSADSATEAVSVLDQHSGPIHLLLTDVVLPDSNGKALYKQISSMREGIMVLFMSGYTTDVISHHGVLDEGMNFIHKPFSGRVLCEKVRQVLEGAN